MTPAVMTWPPVVAICRLLAIYQTPAPRSLPLGPLTGPQSIVKTRVGGWESGRLLLVDCRPNFSPRGAPYSPPLPLAESPLGRLNGPMRDRHLCQIPACFPSCRVCFQPGGSVKGGTSYKGFPIHGISHSCALGNPTCMKIHPLSHLWIYRLFCRGKKD